MKNLFIVLLVITASVSAKAQVKIDSPSDLGNWLPTNLSGYDVDKNVYSAELSQDGAPYFITAKKYVSGEKVLSIVVFDYRKVSDRITKATTSWSLDKKHEDSNQRVSNRVIAGCKASESFDKAKNTSQVYLYCADRYLITLSATAENTDFLVQVAEKLSPTDLPR